MIEQFIANGILAGATYALMGLGFALIFWTARFFNFTYAVTYLTGAYATFALFRLAAVPLPVAALGGVLTATSIGITADLALYGPLRRRGAGNTTPLLVSLGLLIVAQNLLSLLFGADSKSIRSGPVRESAEFLGARVTNTQWMILATSVSLVVAVWVVLRQTDSGCKIRAIACDPELARIVGIDPDRVVLVATGVGSALSGIAAVLVSLDTDITPTMGMHMLLIAVVAVVIGGEGRIVGVFLGGLLIGLTQNLGVWMLSSAWQDAITYILLLVFLLIRPRGFVGKRQREVSV